MHSGHARGGHKTTAGYDKATKTTWDGMGTGFRDEKKKSAHFLQSLSLIPSPGHFHMHMRIAVDTHTLAHLPPPPLPTVTTTTTTTNTTTTNATSMHITCSGVRLGIV